MLLTVCKMPGMCYFVTKEFWAMNKIVQLCSQFHITSLQYGFYLTDHWALLYNDLQIPFVTFVIVRKHLSCKIFWVSRSCKWCISMHIPKIGLTLIQHRRRDGNHGNLSAIIIKNIS